MDPELKKLSQQIASYVASQAKEERKRAARLVMDLCLALRHVGGRPTNRDLVKLARRICRD